VIIPNPMTNTVLADCSVSLDGDIVIIRNDKIERRFDANRLAFLSTTDLTTGKVYDGNIPLCVPIIDMRCSVCHVSCGVEDNNGASDPFLFISLRYAMQLNEFTIRFEIFPGHPFVLTSMFLETPGGSYPTELEPGGNVMYTSFDRSQMLNGIAFGGKHRRMTRYTFYDASDVRSQPVRSQTFHLYDKGKHDEWGNLFHVKDLLCGEELLLVKNAPVCQSHLSRTVPDLRIDGDAFMLCGGGFDYRALPVGPVPVYATTVGVGKNLMRAYRDLMRAINRGAGSLFCMENTWGDRSCDKKLSDSFIRREIDAAAAVGVDIVQIDDGWSKGTVESKEGFDHHVWEGYYDASPDYWTVSKRKFPEGFDHLCRYAADKNVGLGLWFSPDSSHEMRHWEDDVETLCRFYDMGFTNFKLDGITLRTKHSEWRMYLLLEEMTRRTGGNAKLQLDVTAGQRFGFLYHRAYGTVFVENRYTDFGSYYPHETLRNIWCLSEVLPTRQFQFEFLNNRRNPDVYGDDPLAPATYGIDYLFAVTMMTNPLVWMELSELDPADAAVLARAVGAWRTIRDELYTADVTPIGAMPTGFGFTGFYADCGDTGYALLFGELTEDASHFFDIPALHSGTWTASVVDASGGADTAVKNGLRISCEQGGIHAAFPDARSYVLVKLTKSE